MAPPLIIIAGAFAATGYLLNLADRVYLGRVKKIISIPREFLMIYFLYQNRRVRIDEFDFAMDLREERIKEKLKLMKSLAGGNNNHGSVKS